MSGEKLAKPCTERKATQNTHTHCNRAFLFFSELFKLISWVDPINSWYKFNSNQLNVKGSNWKNKKLNGWISFLMDPKKGKQRTNSQCSFKGPTGRPFRVFFFNYLRKLISDVCFFGCIMCSYPFPPTQMSRPFFAKELGKIFKKRDVKCNGSAV